MAGELAGDGLVRVDDGAAMRPGSSLASASGLALTTRSQPSSRSAPPAARRTACSASGVAPMRTWLITRAALLRHAEQVEHGGALAFDMRGHAHEGADGDDAGAADAGDQDAVGLVGDRRQDGQRRQRQLGRRSTPALPPALPLRSCRLRR